MSQPSAGLSEVSPSVDSPRPTQAQPLPAGATADSTEIRVKGKAVRVPSAEIEGRVVLATGRWLKMAAVQDEELVEGETVADPERFVARLKQSGLAADLFTFAQKLPETSPKYAYHIEWDNLAVIPITTYAHWWEKRAESSVRRAVRKANKVGVVARLAEFNDAFVQEVCRIYNDTPVRQGRAFWHYQKDFPAVKRDLSTYCERSVFLGAYYRDELIGFMKIVYVGTIASMLQIFTQARHFDKNPSNALIAKAVENCELDRMSHLTYGRFVYNGASSSLAAFKRRNGFEQVLLPRYYIPLTPKGSLALKLKLHQPLAARIPGPLLGWLLKLRSLWYARKGQAAKEDI